MRMSRRLGVYAGGESTVMVSVYGASEETVTLTKLNGKSYPIIELDEHGISKQNNEIPVGKYIITGSISNEIFPNGRLIEVTKDTTFITTYPLGTIFWFGNGDEAGDSLYVEDFAYGSGHKPDFDTNSNTYNDTYTTIESGNTTISVSATIPGSSGSRHSGTLYSPQYSLDGYSFVNIYASCSYTDRVCFGFPESKPTFSGGKWETDMCVTPTSTDYKFYSMTIPSERANTDGYLAMSFFNASRTQTVTATVKAIWRDTTSDYSVSALQEMKTTIPLSDHYRYCNHIAGGFQSFSGETYVGQGERVAAGEEWNATMIPVPAFSFSGTSRRLKMSLYAYKPYDKNYVFRWAITTSRENEAQYEEGCGAVTNDQYQLASGTFVPSFNYGTYAYQTFVLECNKIPSDTPIYIYLWRNVSTYGNIHINGDTHISLVYTE